ncbi:MAG: hypothetical protein C5B47_00845 [Verrucomicrobia bacterium]|nr:MAG: hypothetical protein C5B47_00845 [Verrucomicrobiota bacterium]
MSDKILLIRGGAVGDFILTLPTVALLRQGFPKARVEILGRPHIVQLVEGRYYAEKTLDLDSPSLSGFFCPDAKPDYPWTNYFSGFQQIISYLYDPDEVFTRNLYRCGVHRIIQGSPKIQAGRHAAFQLAQPLESLGLFLRDPAARLFPSESDRQSAHNVLHTKAISDNNPFIVIHPGSGSQRKTWPATHWRNFCLDFLRTFSQFSILCVGGESDKLALDFLRNQLHSSRLAFLEHLSLPILAAVLSKTSAYAGHDTGISHIAAAVGAPCFLLYGPTDPRVWAPAHPTVHVLTSSTGMMEDLSTKTVFGAFEFFLTTYAGSRNGFSY